MVKIWGERKERRRSFEILFEFVGKPVIVVVVETNAVTGVDPRNILNLAL